MGEHTTPPAVPQPDTTHHHTNSGAEYAVWGQWIVAPGEPIDPVPTVYSDARGIEVGEARLNHAEAEKLIVRIRNALAYERARVGHSPDLLAIDADCPGCGWAERNLNPATGVFGCSKCTYVSKERNA